MIILVKLTLSSGKEYDVKNMLSVKQVRHVRKVAGSLLSINEEITQAGDNESLLMSISQRVITKTDEQDDLIADTLMQNLGLQQDDIDSLGYLDALWLFNELFLKSTTIQKN